MNKKAPGRLLLLCLIIFASASLLSHLFLYNWPLHARLNLLARGYLLCELKDPDQVASLPSSLQSVLIAKLVLNRGNCIGYLNSTGQFTALSDQGDWERELAKDLYVVAGLYYAQFVMLFLSLILVLEMLRRFWKGNQETKVAF